MNRIVKEFISHSDLFAKYALLNVLLQLYSFAEQTNSHHGHWVTAAQSPKLFCRKLSLHFPVPLSTRGHHLCKTFMSSFKIIKNSTTFAIRYEIFTMLL